MGEGAEKRVREQFSLEQTADKISELYAKYLSFNTPAILRR